jgi:hypothetical protein
MRAATIFVLAAWIILCGFQKQSSPQKMKPEQERTNTAQPKTKPDKEHAAPSFAGSRTSNSAYQDANRIDGDAKENIQIVAAAPKKSVDSIERIIAIGGLVCTVALAVVGVYGICIALRTLREMKGQRRAMLGQLREMRKQIGQMQRQADEMVKQTAQLEGSVAAAKDNAAAAKDNADAALLNARTVINAERAWVDIHLFRAGGTKYEFRVTNLGKSPAFITGWVLGRGYWDNGIEIIPVGHPGHHTESAITYNILPVKEEPTCILNFDVASYPPGGNGQSVTYHGHVTYKDIFGQDHRTELVYRLQQPLGETSVRLVNLPKFTRYVTKTKDGEKTN